MSPAEDARLLLAIVRRHLRSLRFGMDPALDRAGRSPAAKGARSG
jgi:hypothetical protein